MSEMRRTGAASGPSVGGGGGGGPFDPSNLHLKKELTQIRKAAKALKDPGTTSSWRSPLSSARSAANNAPSSSNHHYYHHYTTATGADNSNKIPQFAREKKVLLHNWRTQGPFKTPKSRRNDDVVDNENGGSSSSIPEESVEESLSDARNRDGESKSETYIADRYASSTIFKSPNKRNSIKKKSKKASSNNNNVLLIRHQIAKTRNSKQALEGLYQSDDTEEYCTSVASPLLSKLKNKNWLRNSRKEDSSYSYSTPALSTSSYNRYINRNPSTIGSWDGATGSFDGDDEVDDELGRQGCGIPCYWSKRSTPKHRGGSCGSCYSPSLSDTLKRIGSSTLCGSQTMYHRRRRGSSSGYKKRRVVSRTAQGNGDGRGDSSIGTGLSDDELSTNYGELDLEALSRLDGRRWSTSCRSQEGLEIVAFNGEGDEESTPENMRSLTQKYRPMFFEELIGQDIVVQSLMNAILRGRIAPVYLFQGPRGTGKTSTARIFAAALNCLATSEETRPCGICRECTDFMSGKSSNLREVDSTSKKGIDRVKHLLRNLSVGPSSAFLQYRVFIIDECHLLPSKLWLAFLKIFEEPPPRVVFIFMTTDVDNVPRIVLSRCQKYLFNKIKDSDIVARLRKISADENLDVESDALDLIALNADGSLRDAETMLDQLSLLGKRISTSLVNELVGVVSDEKLLELLELAMSSDTAETVKRARELMDSGVDPMVVMSQLATLIMDIIAGTYHIIDSRNSDSLVGGRSLTESELDRLKHALKLLSEAEKQLRVSSERSTWFTATLLQLGSVPTSDATQSGSSRRQSSKTTEEDPSSVSREATARKQRPDALRPPQKSTSPTSLLPKAALQNLTIEEDPFPLANGVNIDSNHTQSRFINGNKSGMSHDDVLSTMLSRCINSEKLDDIWERCIERCHSKTLKQLLLTHGKLISISEVEGLFIAYVAFGDKDIKTRAERFLSSITNSFEIVLRYNVEVRIILLPDAKTLINSGKTVALQDSLGRKQMDTTNAVSSFSDLDLRKELLKISRGSFDNSEGKLGGTFQSAAGSPIPLVEGDAKTSGTKERNPMQRIESIIHEQKLETAWLQAVEKGTPGSLGRLKPEKNQILPQEGIFSQNQMESINSLDLTSQNWEDELNHEIKLMKINDGKAVQKDQIGRRIDHCPISPSLLHDSSFMGNISKETMGYESGSGPGGCSGLFCWNNAKTHKRVKVKQGTPVRSQKGVRFMWFGECAKPKKTENRIRR